MLEKISWASPIAGADSDPSAACPAAKRIAARVVESHRRGEIDALADRGRQHRRRRCGQGRKPTATEAPSSFSRARASRLRSVPGGHRSRRAASSSVSPSK